MDRSQSIPATQNVSTERSNRYFYDYFIKVVSHRIWQHLIKRKYLKPTCRYATEFIRNEAISRQNAGTRQFCMNNEELAQEFYSFGMARQRLLWHMPDEY